MKRALIRCLITFSLGKCKTIVDVDGFQQQRDLIIFIRNILLSCNFYILLYNATGLSYNMSEIPCQNSLFFKIYIEDNLWVEPMRQVGKELTKTPTCCNILEEHSYSRPLEDNIFNETSVGESIEIDPEVCLDWRKGRRVAELSLLADKIFCVMCQARLHLCDTINETKQGLGSILKIKCAISVCNATNNHCRKQESR